MLWCTFRLREVYSDVYKNTCSVYSELSETDSSLPALPLRSQTTTAWKTACVLHGSRRLVWTLSTASDEPFPKETQTRDFFFFQTTNLSPPQPRNFPQQIKSKLLKGWFTLSLISLLYIYIYIYSPWCVTLLKRDSTTRQRSVDEHHPGDLTQCWCLVLMKTEWENEGRSDFCNLL